MLNHWIPAFAGMTTEREGSRKGCPYSRFAYPAYRLREGMTILIRFNPCRDY